MDYYEIVSVQPGKDRLSVHKITLTPPVDVCFRPAKIEMAAAKLPLTVAELFEQIDPCQFSDKELRREEKRKSDMPRFSGVETTLRLRCGNKVRTIQTELLDRDLFDRYPQTPKYTSWSAKVLKTLDNAIGNRVMDKPALQAFMPAEAPLKLEQSALIDSLREGKYDSLFGKVPDQPSDLYRQAQFPPAIPSLELVSSTPFTPADANNLKFPPIAQVVHLGGEVILHLKVGDHGKVKSVQAMTGPVLLQNTSKEIVRNWYFPEAPEDQEIEVKLSYNLNCASLITSVSAPR